MWIFDGESEYSLRVKDIVEIADYEINIDEETNATSTISVIKKTTAKAKDIIVVKKNNEVIYWGIIQEIQNEDGAVKTTFIVKYLTNIFDRQIQLTGEDVIRTTGLEDFINRVIMNFFSNTNDTMANIAYLWSSALTHTPKQINVSNVENGIYNLHTWMTNVTQMYGIVYVFSIIPDQENNWKIKIDIKYVTIDKELVDTLAQNISSYTEVYETDVMAKVNVLYSKVNGEEQAGAYRLYLKTDRTTTTDGNDPDRAKGNITTVYTENYEDAPQTALDVMKANSYNHNITFNYDKYIGVGTPIAIKTKNSIIYDTYISSIKITPKKFYEYICGNIRINFIDKLLKERK